MKPTHQVKGGGEDVTAWQFTETNSVPAWVFRHFHDLGDHPRALTYGGRTKVRLTNWIVCPCDQDPRKQVAFVFTNKEFMDNFIEWKALPVKVPAAKV